MSNPRTERIHVRITPEEHKALAAMAGAEGLSISDYVRRRSLIEETRPKLVVNEEMLKQIYSNHRRAAGLLNQAMFAINRSHAIASFENQLDDALRANAAASSAVADFIQQIKDYL